MTTEKKLATYISGRGLKIKYVAEKAEIPYQHLQTALLGTRKLKSDEFLRVCAVLDVDPRLFAPEKAAV